MAKEKYGYAVSSDLAATYGDGHIYSVVDEANELENGMIVKLGKAIDRENYEISTPEDGDPIVLVLDVILPYNETTTADGFEIYYNFAKGKPVRSYNIIANDKFEIIDYLVTSTIAGSGNLAVEGNYLVHDGNRKYKEIASGTDVSTYGFVAEIVDIVEAGGMTKYLLNVVKNSAVAANE